MANLTSIPRDDAGKLDLLKHLNASLPGYAALLNGQPNLNWAKVGMDAVEIEVDRGGGFTLLTFDTQPGYLDTAQLPAPGTTALWRYRAIYRLKDQRVGHWSPVLEVAVKGS